MKKGIQCILSLLLAFMLCAGLFAVFGMHTVKAADDIASGTYDGVDWRITSDYELIIGDGTEQTFTYREKRDDKSYPWDEYREQIKTCRFDGKVYGNGSMGQMFYHCYDLISIDFSSFDTSNVTQMYDMFAYCHNLTSLDLSGFDTSNVTSMAGMFLSCRVLPSIDVSKFDTKNVYAMASMFDGCEKLTSLDLSMFNTSNVTYMHRMFERCSSLQSLDISGFDTRKVTLMDRMFSGCLELKSIKLSPDMTKWLYYGPLPTPTGTDYTGKWIREDGLVGPFTSSELRDQYPKNAAEWAGTWVWEERPASTIIFNGTSQATGSMPNDVIYVSDDYQIPLCQYAIFDYTFLYWDDGQGNHWENNAVIPAGTYEPESTITLTAVFEKNDHHISMQDGSFEFSIKAGEKATFNDIPAGTSYQVYEKTEDGWVLVQQENASGVIEALEESAAAFWNQYQPGVVTVQFTGTKKLDGHPAKEGTYQFELVG